MVDWCASPPAVIEAIVTSVCAFSIAGSRALLDGSLRADCLAALVFAARAELQPLVDGLVQRCKSCR